MSINFQVFTSSKNTSKDDLCNLRSVKCVKTMATSNEAQVVVWCKYCERYPAQYKCDDCGDKMCQTCKDSHKEYPHFFNHIIVTYPDCETAKKRCRDHPSQFYTQGCKKCGIPICPECKIKSHYNHKDTDITTVCENAKIIIQKALTDMQSKERGVNNYMTNGEGFHRSEDFKQAKIYLREKGKEMKTCIDELLSNSIEEVEKHECYYQTHVKNYISELSNTFKKMRSTCENNLERLNPIDLTFYVHEHPDWNYVSQPHDIQGLRIVRFGPREINKFEIEGLFGSLSFEETNIGDIFGITQSEQPKTPELNHVSQRHDIQGLNNMRFEPNPSDNSKLKSFFGTLPLRETNVRQRSENTQTKRPKTAAAKIIVPKHPLRTNSPTRHREVPKTERHCHSRPTSPTFHSTENMHRIQIGILELPWLLTEFKTSVNFLYHVAFDEESLSVFISGNRPEIFTYQNVSGVRNTRYKTFFVENEVQGLTIGFKNKLVYSDSQNGVIEVGRNVIYANRNEMAIDIRKNARVIFNKEGYNFWGIDYTSSGKYLVCAWDQLHNNALILAISNDGRVENEFQNNARGEPIFSRPLFVCENGLNQNICVSDMDFKVIILTMSGKVIFNYTGDHPAGGRAPFMPRGIACDGRGNILVADVDNDVIHLLKSDGEFVTHILSSISPISQPWGISVDSKDRVWVVERNNNAGEVQMFAKLKFFQIYKPDNRNQKHSRFSSTTQKPLLPKRKSERL